MKASLQLKATQQLTMTPQLQQSIRLLQLSSVELQQEIAQALTDNPMLERDDTDDGAPYDTDADTTTDDTRTGDDRFTTASDSSVSDHLPTPNPQDIDDSALYDTAEPSVASRDENYADTADAFEQSTLSDLDEGPYAFSAAGGENYSDHPDLDNDGASPSTQTLREYLLTQAGLLRITWREQALLRILIEALDERGYLSTSLEELLASLPAEEAVQPSELDAALTQLQSLDPAGVGARSLNECLLLQLKDSTDPNTPLASTLITDHLNALAQRDFVLIRRKTGASDQALRAAQDLIRTLKPHPGNAFLDDASPYIIPDVLVRRNTKTGNNGQTGWLVTTNPDALPRLRINRLYSSLLRQSSNSHSGLSNQLQEARWLIRNVMQRFETIERVAQAIVKEQSAFFEKGELAMRPLVLREIADQLGLHESTISRVTTQKFMATPRGVFEFKYFFGSHVATEQGGAASATAIKARIRQLISEENAKKPLSDQQICAQFMLEGIVVARRTIAKYREAMGISTASLRKTL